MREIFVKYSDVGEFRGDQLRDLPAGGLFFRTEEAFDVGESVLATVSIPDLPDGVTIRSTVIWRRAPTRWRSALLPGIGLGFDEKHRNRWEFLVDFCNGDLSALRKKGRRLPADFRVDILATDQRIPGRAKDISRGGVFVVTETLLARGSSVDLALYLSTADPPELFAGRVAWSRPRGPEPGLGVEFLFRTPVKRAQISSLVREIEGRLSVPPPAERR
jgi:type IV pilus assembly protein PilZ